MRNLIPFFNSKMVVSSIPARTEVTKPMLQFCLH